MTLFKGLIVVVFAIPVLAAPYLYQRYQDHQNFNLSSSAPPTMDELEAVAKTKKKKSTHKTTYAPERDIEKDISGADEANGKNVFLPETNTLGQDILGINTADVREDTSSVQFLNLFKTAIPFNETIPWGSSKGVEFDENGWPKNLNGGKAGTKFLNRLPEGTVEDGFFTVLYDGEGEIFYGNDARIVVHRPNKDIIEIKAGKDHILNASLFIKKTTPDNYIRNIRILPEGGVCKGFPHIRVKTAAACGAIPYLAFEENEDKLLFNPDYLAFMKDFQVIRFMNMSGMTRNPVEKWDDRNKPEKATWGGKYGSRGAPVEIMVALANQVKANPWFSMPYKASDDYVRKFGEYVKKHLDPDLKAYIEYSNEVWNPIFIHHDYAIQQGLKEKLDKKKSPAGYKWYSKRSVEVFKIWEDVFGGQEQLIRVLGSWASNQSMSSLILSYNDAYKHTDALAIGPYVSAHPKVLRKAKSVDDVFKAMMDKNSKWGMKSIISYIQKQSKVAHSFGVDLVAYEGGQHLVDWNTRKVDEHPNELLYAANRDPRMGIVYDELLREWRKAGGKLFVAFSAPRIYSWYGSWGIKEHIRQPRSDAPKYDALLRYLENVMHPERAGASRLVVPEDSKPIPVSYAKYPYQIWDMSKHHQILSKAINTNPSDISANWQTSWDSRHLYLSFAVTDESLEKGDEIVLTLDDLDKKAEEKEKKQQEKKKKIAVITNSEKDKSEKKESDTSSNKSKNKAKAESNSKNSSKDKKQQIAIESIEGEKEHGTEDGTEDKKEDKKEIETVKTFTFTPFDSLGTQTHLTLTDTGYLINVAIPWSEIKSTDNPIVKTNSKLGINIQITDVDLGEKGSQHLYLSDQNSALPELQLKYRMAEKK